MSTARGKAGHLNQPHRPALNAAKKRDDLLKAPTKNPTHESPVIVIIVIIVGLI